MIATFVLVVDVRIRRVQPREGKKLLLFLFESAQTVSGKNWNQGRQPVQP